MISHDLEPELRSADPEPELYRIAREEPGRYQQIKKHVWDEVYRRVESDPKSVPDVQLYRMFVDTAKIDLALARRDTDAPDNEVPNLHALIQAAQGLPLNARAQILTEARSLALQTLEEIDALSQLSPAPLDVGEQTEAGEEMEPEVRIEGPA